MDFYDATELMRFVQAVENDPIVSSGAGEALASKVREFIEDEAEMGGWYTELMNAIGEGEIDPSDALDDFTVGRFRVHLVQEGERYGANGSFVYGKSLSNGSFGTPVNDCQLYGHGLPMVEFYDMSQDSGKFPDGQFVSRYYMSTLLGMDSGYTSIGDMQALALDIGIADWTISGDDLQKVHSHLIAARDLIEQETPQVGMKQYEPTFKECGTFTDHGFGFHAQDGTRTDYVIGWPLDGGVWAVLTGSYDLESDELADYYLPEDYLNDLLSRYGYSSLTDFKSINGDTWHDTLTGIIAKEQEANRFEVPHLCPDPSAAERYCIYEGVPNALLRPAMEKARAEYEKVKASQSPEKAVSLKGEVEKARGASAAMADNGNHSNRGQDAR